MYRENPPLPVISIVFPHPTDNISGADQAILCPIVVQLSVISVVLEMIDERNEYSNRTHHAIICWLSIQSLRKKKQVLSLREKKRATNVSMPRQLNWRGDMGKIVIWLYHLESKYMYAMPQHFIVSAYIILKWAEISFSMCLSEVLASDIRHGGPVSK